VETPSVEQLTQGLTRARESLARLGRFL